MMLVAIQFHVHLLSSSQIDSSTFFSLYFSYMFSTERRERMGMLLGDSVLCRENVEFQVVLLSFNLQYTSSHPNGCYQ